MLKKIKNKKTNDLPPRNSKKHNSKEIIFKYLKREYYILAYLKKIRFLKYFENLKSN